MVFTVNAGPPFGAPHQFFGSVSINGNPAPDNVLITAKIDGSDVAGTDVSNGTYGYEPNTFYVSDPQGNYNGDTIEFFINDAKAGEAIFKNGESTELDLSASISNFCGDGICESGETCNSCQIDCGQCQNNNDDGDDGSPTSSGGLFTPPDTNNASNDTVNFDNTDTDQIDGQNECTERWKCSDWFDCFNNKQERVCVDMNECGTNETKPIEGRNCTSGVCDVGEKTCSGNNLMECVNGSWGFSKSCENGCNNDSLKCESGGLLTGFVTMVGGDIVSGILILVLVVVIIFILHRIWRKKSKSKKKK